MVASPVFTTETVANTVRLVIPRVGSHKLFQRLTETQ